VADAQAFVVPPVLRTARFVPRQSPGRRQPAQVTPGAFRAAGLPVPANPAQQNAYQLSGRQGNPWSPAIDRHIGRRGGELLGGGMFLLVDIDVPAAVDGTPLADPLRWLCDRAVEAGEFLDLRAALAIATPGHPDQHHLPGWHLWFRADPGYPVRMGPLSRCRHVEMRSRGTCPGSPGYEIRSAPADLPVVPRWLSHLAGPPPAPVMLRAGASGPSMENRLHGIIERLLSAGQGERNHLLYWASLRTGELVAAGALEQAAAVAMLRDAAGEIGLLAEDGEGPVLATIGSGLRQAGAA
jgi:hypothetical protein